MVSIDAVIENVLKRPLPEWFSYKAGVSPTELRYFMKEAILEYQRKVDERNALTHLTPQQLDEIEKNMNL